ncbi:NAD(P)/FAD-dependent oxidoreductase [Salinisphaera aquimarina]|uniref:NAD(P)/FAD-dependent oxidoreductase n=1 Tax=Salinisphaera aquimarina TaxID=2094031 RepID=A0ABV7EM53_9GAMM
MSRPKNKTAAPIIIVGGGAGGAELAVKLAADGQAGVRLIDREATHVWKPRIHELAAGLRRGHVDELGYAGLAQRWGFAFERGTLADIDADANTIRLAAERDDDGQTLVPERSVAYRALVLALGGVTPDLGVDGVLEHAFMLDSARDAEVISERFSARLLAHARGVEDRAFDIVIVGTGATGVELAAHLATDARSTTLTPPAALPDIRITLVEAADTFMPGMNDKVRQSIGERLKKAGVRIETGQQIGKVSADAVETEEGARFTADMTIWATGRVGPPVAGDIQALSTNKKRQWRVRKTLQSLDSDAVFALGDCSYIDDEPAPPTAQAASEQAAHLAKQLPRYLAGETLEPFSFTDQGTLLSLGEAGSVGAVRGWFSDDIQVRGRLARTAYRGLQRQHQLRLLGRFRGSIEILGDVLGEAAGPDMKVY